MDGWIAFQLRNCCFMSWCQKKQNQSTRLGGLSRFKELHLGIIDGDASVSQIYPVEMLKDVETISGKLTFPRVTAMQCKTTGSNYEVMTSTMLQDHMHYISDPV